MRLSTAYNWLGLLSAALAGYCFAQAAKMRSKERIKERDLLAQEIADELEYREAVREERNRTKE